jgi:DNA gyrase inhibitor GyrI
MEPVPNLQTLPEGKVELSTAEIIIVKNYGLYHELKAKYEAFQNWAKQQKALNP